MFKLIFRKKLEIRKISDFQLIKALELETFDLDENYEIFIENDLIFFFNEYTIGFHMYRVHSSKVSGYFL